MVQSTVERGASNEALAARSLCAAGYQLVECNFECDSGELDIVARDGSVLVFVEVRSRSGGDHGDASEMVTPAKRRRVAHIAAIYLEMRRPRFEECRFDVVAITGDDVQIIKDAWRAGERA